MLAMSHPAALAGLAEIAGLKAAAARRYADPVAAETARASYRSAHEAGVASGLIPARVPADEIRRDYPIIDDDARLDVGVGWDDTLREALKILAGLDVRVTGVREKGAAISITVLPRRDGWKAGEQDVVSTALRMASQRSLRTCEACGASGSYRGGLGLGRIRCHAHAAIP